MYIVVRLSVRPPVPSCPSRRRRRRPLSVRPVVRRVVVVGPLYVVPRRVPSSPPSVPSVRPVVRSVVVRPLSVGTVRLLSVVPSLSADAE